MNRQSGNLQKWLAVLLGAVVLLVPALYNGYPMVDPDAGTYIASGFKFDTPIDRPITYGLLVRMFSLNGFSLWGVVATQALLLSWLLTDVVEIVLAEKFRAVFSIGIIAVLSCATSLPWLVGMIHPDIFTAVCFLLLFKITVSAKPKWWWYLFFWVAVAVHMSHPLLFTGFSVVLIVVAKFVFPGANPQLWKRYLLTASLSLSTILIMGSAISKSKHVFLTGTLVEKGVLKVFLKEQCATHNYQLCRYYNELPETSDGFLWNESGPLYKIGGWSESKKELTQMDHDLLTTPRYLWMYCSSSIRQFFKQLNYFDILTGTFNFPPGSNVHLQISAYVPRDIHGFEKATQNRIDLPEELIPFKLYLRWIVYLSAVVLLLMLALRSKSFNSQLKIVLIICLGGYILNIADFSLLATVSGRYAAKMVWVIPFLCLLTAFYLRLNKKVQKT